MWLFTATCVSLQQTNLLSATDNSTAASQQLGVCSLQGVGADTHRSALSVSCNHPHGPQCAADPEPSPPFLLPVVCCSGRRQAG